MIFLHMTLVMKLPTLPTAGTAIMSVSTGSVASAKATNVSVIKPNHKSSTSENGTFPERWF